MFDVINPLESLSLKITDTFGLEPDSREHGELFTLCLAYIGRQISAVDFQKKVTALTGKSSLTFRIDISQSIYVLRQIKACLVHLSQVPLVNLPNICQFYDIHESDRQALRHAYPKLKQFEFAKASVARVCNLSQLDQELNDLVPEIKKFCENFVMKKLYFVMKSCNIEMHDLVSELLCKAITTFYHTSLLVRPLLHTLNGLRSSCKNHGQNMINYFTAKKRSRLNQVGDYQFSLAMVSENQLSDSYIYSQASKSAEHPGHSDLVTRLSIKTVIARLKKKFSARKAKFLDLIQGIYDEKFSEFLTKKGIRVANDEYFDKAKTNQYIKLAQDFLKLPATFVENTLSYLRLALA